MAKKRRPSYLAPKSLLTKQEYMDYQMRQKIEAGEKLQKQIEQQKKLERYKLSRSGRISGKITKGFSFLKGGVASSLYARHQPISQKLTSTGGTRTGARGRPRGSFDPRYARYGGVYGYRKLLATQLRVQRMEALRRSTVTPRQEMALRQIQIRQAQQRMSPERQVIPGTEGGVPIKGIMDEINDAANIVG